MSEQDALGGFVPFNDAHAIVTSALTIQFAGPVPEEVWPSLRKAIYSAGRELDLGLPAPFFNTSITFDPARVAIFFNSPPPGSVDTSGLAFTRLDEDEIIVERIVAARDHIQVTTNSYVRWDPFFRKASELIEKLYNIYADNLVFASNKLEYWDRFDFRGEGEPSLGSLLDLGSPWIASSFAQTSEASHSYSGRFESFSSSLRRLTNVRIDYQDYPNRDGTTSKAVIIHTMLQDAANAPGYEATERNAYGVKDVLCMLGGQHSALKELLRGVITRKAGARIGL